ncbi:MAG: hypothetical protein ABH834_02800 [Candidatus Altiarchaeota archaeon]
MGGWIKPVLIVVFVLLASGCVQEKDEAQEYFECPSGQLVTRVSDCPGAASSSTTVALTTMLETTTSTVVSCDPEECALLGRICFDGVCVGTTTTTVSATSTTTLDYPKSITVHMQEGEWHYFLGYKIKLSNIFYWDTPDGKIAPNRVYFTIMPPDEKNTTKIVKVDEPMNFKTATIQILDVIGVRYHETVKVNFTVREPTTTTFIPGNTSLCPDGTHEVDDHRLCPDLIIH